MIQQQSGKMKTNQSRDEEKLKQSSPSQYDVIVVGAGAAGLYAALSLPEKYQIAVLFKDNLKTGASDWAQGGIAAAIALGDSPELHFEDTIKAGAGLCDPAAVRFLVENAPSAIASLVNLGVGFDRQGENLAMTLEAAHSRPRVLHAADTTGKAIVDTLTELVLQKHNIKVIPQAQVLNLWLEENTCVGISLLQEGAIHWLRAKATILATGGGGQVFARTTNPSVSTGDGVALAWRCGALLRDLEFIQFHPTALTKTGAPPFLISEAVRGEGAHLIDSEGYRFAFDYHPDGELAPRDVVSRAIFSHLQKTTSDPSLGNVYLDLRGIDPQRVQYRFPNIIKVCKHWGINLFEEPIPVAPAAHYWMGGIATDLSNRTTIKGLYAIGETTSTGVHGANRLASNSLLECIVFASALGELQLEHISTSTEYKAILKQPTNWEEELHSIKQLREELPRVMWQSAGITRTEKTLAEAIQQVQQWREEFNQLKINQYLQNLSPLVKVEFEDPSKAQEQIKLAAETLNLLDIGYLIFKSALFRTESRGGHYRSDYPQPSPAWEKHTLIKSQTQHPELA